MTMRAIAWVLWIAFVANVCHLVWYVIRGREHVGSRDG